MIGQEQGRMTEEAEGRGRTLTDHTAELVAAYVSNNHVARVDLPILIATVQRALSALSRTTTPSSTENELRTPTHAQICRSITPDAIISFIDGKPYKALKRHLRGHGFDPMSYRQKYGLPHDYPMVAPTYSERRSALSRGYQFGKYNRP